MPGTYCAVYGCNNNNNFNSPTKMLTYHRLPKESDRLKIWLKQIGRNDIMQKKNPRNYYVCSIHFASDMKINKKLHDDAVPTLKLPPICKTGEEKTKRAPKKKTIKTVDKVVVTVATQTDNSIFPTDVNQRKAITIGTQTMLTKVGVRLTKKTALKRSKKTIAVKKVKVEPETFSNEVKLEQEEQDTPTCEIIFNVPIKKEVS
ncbi:hypothetical protein JYU34_017175 [Plutella xylostella]|uniref:THAP-type domain-containing protein n=1 Tax=Plutella xylostella TaxID=51655 RepID=A0ABQ7Q1Y3_PLUXY|nr:hypothetical protein JYU34_017175 [Plutella xylostella]